MNIRLIIAIVLCCSFSASAQLTTVYTQRQLSAWGKIGIFALGPADTSGLIVGFIAKRGYFFIDPGTRTARMDTVYTRAGDCDFATIQPYKNGFVSLARSSENVHTIWDAKSGFRQLPIPDSLTVLAIGYGMSFYPGNYILSSAYKVLTPDLGNSWFRYPDSLQRESVDLNGFNTPVLSATGSQRLYSLFVNNLTTAVQPTPIVGIPTSTANLHNDSIVWSTNTTPAKIRIGALNDTRFYEISGLTVGDSLWKLQPSKLLGLSSGAVLYVDKTGKAAKIEGGQAVVYDEAFPVPDFWTSVYRNTIKCRLTSVNGRHGLCVVNLSDPPSFDTWRFTSSLAGSLGVHDCGHSGWISSRVEAGELFFDIINRDILITGSILRDFEFLDLRRMLFCHESIISDQTILNDCDVLLKAEGRLGHAILGGVRASHTEAYQQLRGNPDFIYPEQGLTMVALNDTTLAFPGSVVRTMSTSGLTLDTLLRRPATSVSRLNDGTLVSSNKGLLRFHRQTLDTVIIAPDSLQGAETVGYPSMVTSAADGSILCGVLGMWRRHPDSVEARPISWGGILRSADAGKTWSTIPLPDPRSNQVLGISVTPSNALIAVTTRLEEDTLSFEADDHNTYFSSYVHILRSTDNGLNWVIVKDVFYSGLFIPCAGSLHSWSGLNMLSVATPGGLFNSSDDGITWEVDYTLPFLSTPISLSAGNQGTMLVSSTTGVYRIDRPTSVASGVYDRHHPKPRLIQRSALLSMIEAATDMSPTITDLKGATVFVKSMSYQTLFSLPLGIYTIRIDEQPITFLLAED